MVEGPFRTKKTEAVILVPNVNGSCIEKLLEWTEHQIDDGPLEENDGYIPDIGEWDQQLLQVEKNVLAELNLASDYLDNQRLLDMTSRADIDSMKKQTTTQR
ncbi:hypothetical protein RP20_CCG016156 [Aedes albopictus]|nr:hypothetical protein RP20_CCG016156 [Aedes albopictus]